MTEPTKKPAQARPRPTSGGRKPGAARSKAAGSGRKPVKTAPPPPRRRPVAIIAAALTLGIDQLSKWVVIQRLDLPRQQEIFVLDPWLNLRMAWNQGMNFGLMASSQDLTRWLLIAIALAVCVWVGVWVWRSGAGLFMRIAAGLLIGGALGNVIDRLAYGAVADFLNMSLPGWHNPYSFNIADIAIFVGAVGLVFHPQKRQDPVETRKSRTKTGAKPRDARRKTR